MLSGLVVVSSFYVQNVFVIHVFVIFALYDALQVPKSMHARLAGPFNVLHHYCVLSICSISHRPQHQWPWWAPRLGL